MSEELVIPSNPETSIAKADDAMFADLVGGGFLPRLQLQTSNSSVCKSGDFPVNHYAHVQGKSMKDLGKTVDVYVIAYRAKALDTSDDLIDSYDPSSDVFISIKNRANNEQNSGCMYGPEFLVWNEDIGFATFFCGSKTARNIANGIRGAVPEAGESVTSKGGVTLGSTLIKNKKFEWQAPTVEICTDISGQPTAEEFTAKLHQFNNPSSTSNVETAEEEETGGREV